MVAPFAPDIARGISHVHPLTRLGAHAHHLILARLFGQGQAPLEGLEILVEFGPPETVNGAIQTRHDRLVEHDIALDNVGPLFRGKKLLHAGRQKGCRG